MQIEDYLWIIPVTLAIIAFIQVLYALWLSRNSREIHPRQQPSAPIMPGVRPAYAPPEEDEQAAVAAKAAEQAHSYSDNLLRATGGAMIVLKGLSISEITLPASQFTIGRFYNPDQNILIALDERSVSRRHALFSGDPHTGEYFLTDTRSSFGTHIRIENHFQPLAPGKAERIYDDDVVQFGQSVTVRFVLPGDSRNAATSI